MVIGRRCRLRSQTPRAVVGFVVCVDEIDFDDSCLTVRFVSVTNLSTVRRGNLSCATGREVSTGVNIKVRQNVLPQGT